MKAGSADELGVELAASAIMVAIASSRDDGVMARGSCTGELSKKRIFYMLVGLAEEHSTHASQMNKVEDAEIT